MFIVVTLSCRIVCGGGRAVRWHVCISFSCVGSLLLCYVNIDIRLLKFTVKLNKRQLQEM